MQGHMNVTFRVSFSTDSRRQWMAWFPFGRTKSHCNMYIEVSLFAIYTLNRIHLTASGAVSPGRT